MFSEEVTSQIERQELKLGEVLFDAGDPAVEFFFCEKGCVRLEVFPEDNKPLVFYRAREGFAFAEEHIALSHFAYRGVADEDSIIQRVARKLVLDDVRADPIIAQRFVYCLAQRNFLLQANFQRLGIRSAKDRVYHLLTSLQVQNPGPLELGGKIKSFSDDLNLTHEAMYRALKKLEDEGKITRKDGTIRVLAEGLTNAQDQSDND